jgi:ADP-dependent NAD(P)H-hydrate dehydratase / NAD(P)H-hydrate epimerase
MRQGTSGPEHLALLDAEAARAGDAAAVDAGDTWAALMERAAGHLARGILEAGGHGYGLKVAVLVGKGNNGGDGWAAARRLRERGAAAWVVAPDGVDVEVSDEAGAHRAAWIGSGGRTSTGFDDVEAALRWADVAVDALLGTGTTGAPRGPAAEAVQALRAAHAGGTTIVACDIPSGVSADDGAVTDDAAVRADVTVTFGALKRGLLLHPGATYAGRVVLGDLGERYDTGERYDAGERTDLGVRGGASARGRAGAGEGGHRAVWAALTPSGAAPPALPPEADKRARGVVVTVAGAVGTAGAAVLASEGAMRAGAGLVTAAVPDPVRRDVAAAADPGVMVRPLPADENGAVGHDAIHALPDLAGVDAVVAGPGLGHGPGATELVRALRATSTSLVLDADALNVHRDAPEELADHRGALVLTPHERELARIGGGEDGPDAWRRRVEQVPTLAADLDATIVVKGPGTMVVAPDGRVWVCPLGGPALGSGGTGDVLAGVVGAAVARGDDVPLAVARAVWWHAAAGERVGGRSGGWGTATDVLRELPEVLADLRGWVEGRLTQDAASHGLPWDRWRALGHAVRHEGSDAR